jgi:CHAD domain-containing protein
MYPLAARRALARRLDVLSKNLPLALAGEVEGVHRARVASRRLRELLAVLSPGKGAGDRKAWRAAATGVRAVTRALGGVRELDVALALLDEILGADPTLTPAVITARSFIERTRAARRDQMTDELAEVDVAKLARRLDRLVTVRGDGRHRAEAFGLYDRLAARVGQLDLAVAEAGALFSLDRLHDVRIAAKKLRYALELADELLRVGTKRPTERLRGMQDLLGRMHDLAVLAEFVRRAGGATGGEGQVKDLLGVIEREVHALHARYLARVGVLARVVDEWEGILAKLSHQRPPAAGATPTESE